MADKLREAFDCVFDIEPQPGGDFVLVSRPGGKRVPLSAAEAACDDVPALRRLVWGRYNSLRLDMRGGVMRPEPPPAWW